jgi:hypothetical protein
MLTVKQVAEQLGVSEGLIYDHSSVREIREFLISISAES